MAKDTESEKKLRIEAIQNASKYAAEVPYQVMQTSYKSLDLLKAMLEIGNPASMSDTGVGALCCLTAIEGAYMNVRINIKDLNDKDFALNLNKKANKLMAEAKLNFGLIIKQVHENIH
jgi:glutamate formiminotransferase/formiminotetrahydrofolate cyclodeaminase